VLAFSEGGDYWQRGLDAGHCKAEEWVILQPRHENDASAAKEVRMEAAISGNVAVTAVDVRIEVHEDPVSSRAVFPFLKLPRELRDSVCDRRHHHHYHVCWARLT
jgi:hypothetical protein